MEIIRRTKGDLIVLLVVMTRLVMMMNLLVFGSHLRYDWSLMNRRMSMMMMRMMIVTVSGDWDMIGMWIRGMTIGMLCRIGGGWCVV